jgi:hypothetical protein
MDGGFRAEVELEGRRRSGEAMLDLKGEEMIFSGEVEIGIGPCRDVGAAAESLCRIRGFGFAGVMDEEDGEVEVALHGPEGTEELRDISGGVFVEASDADERVEDEELRSDVFYSGSESVEIRLTVEAEDRDIEEEERDVEKGEVTSFCDVFETSAKHGESVLGAVEEDRPFEGNL